MKVKWGNHLSLRGALFVAGAILLGAVVFGAVSPLNAVIGLAVLLLASLTLRRTKQPIDDHAAASGRSSAADAEWLIDAAITGLPDPVIVLDRDARVVAFNAGAHEIAPALARGSVASLGLRAPEVIDAIRQASASGQTQRVEFSQQVPIERWLAVHVMPVESSAGPHGPALKLLVVSFRDLTPLRRVEEMRVDFVANASHELRTPLATLSGFIETLQGPARDDPTARERFLAIMKTQAARMARLIDDLLSLSRIELNEHIHPDKPVEIVAIVGQVADSLHMLARDRDVAITIDASIGPMVVLGDRDELIRVFENLIENALKYGADGRKVEIRLARSDAAKVRGDAVISVRDHGPGIAPEHLPRLTERFYRVDVAHSRAEGGTGLGLALVKHILNRHRGRLSIESTVGEGATFTVRLPLAGSLASRIDS